MLKKATQKTAIGNVNSQYASCGLCAKPAINSCKRTIKTSNTAQERTATRVASAAMWRASSLLSGCMIANSYFPVTTTDNMLSSMKYCSNIAKSEGLKTRVSKGESNKAMPCPSAVPVISVTTLRTNSFFRTDRIAVFSCFCFCWVCGRLHKCAR